jgi:hypothetical protein
LPAPVPTRPCRVSPFCCSVLKPSVTHSYEFDYTGLFECRRSASIYLNMLEIWQVLFRWLRCLGHSGPSASSPAESLDYEPQVVESSGFEQLQSIYKRHGHSDRCAGQAILKIAPKSSRLNRHFSRKVAVRGYNFDYIGRLTADLAARILFILLGQSAEVGTRPSAPTAGDHPPSSANPHGARLRTRSSRPFQSFIHLRRPGRARGIADED